MISRRAAAGAVRPCRYAAATARSAAARRRSRAACSAAPGTRELIWSWTVALYSATSAMDSAILAIASRVTARPAPGRAVDVVASSVLSCPISETLHRCAPGRQQFAPEWERDGREYPVALMQP